MAPTHQSLADALPQEQARCRELMERYRSLGVPGSFAVFLLEQSLRRADRAAASGDIGAMVGALAELRAWKD